MRSQRLRDGSGCPVRGLAVLAAGVVLSACASSCGHVREDTPPLTVDQANANAPFLPPLPEVMVSGELKDTGDAAIRKAINVRPAKWPLRFKRSFGFGARCVNTLDCHVVYDGMRYGRSSSVGAGVDPYAAAELDLWKGTQASFGFAEPVEVRWRAPDGTALEASVDLRSIFKGRQVLHVVPRHEVSELPGGDHDLPVHVLLEVNGRSINVYMRAYVPTRHLQRAGQVLRGSRRDLILAKTLRY